jgi:Ca-activated chloride channel family protein
LQQTRNHHPITNYRLAVVFVALMVFVFQFASAQKLKTPSAPALTRIEFLFDGSQSMYGKWQTGAKIDVAKKLMNELLDSLRFIPNIELALRVYGHQKNYPPQDCDDSKLEVPFSKGNTAEIQRVLKGITPRGTTPIAMSLERSAEDFPSTPSRNILILITDGIEECGGDPCAVSQALQKKGIFLKPFVIGMGLDVELKKTFDCVGRFFDATNESMFKQALDIVISQALNNTTMQVNLLDNQLNPTETNVNMSFYDRFTGENKYNFIHTLNSRGNPDTLVLDPLPVYNIVVNTIPQVRKDSIVLTPGKHTIVGIDAPQGYLKLSYDDSPDARKTAIIVRKQNELNTLNVQDMNSTEKYLVGKYDLEILTLPRTMVYGVSIDQSKTTSVTIPRPGIVSIVFNAVGYGSVYSINEKKLDWVCNLDESQTRETIYLQPGKYHVVFRPKNSRESIYTLEKDFSIISGESNVIVIN